MARVANEAVRIVGLSEFLTKMKAAEQAIPNKVMRQGLNEAAALVVAAAQGRSPVKTGALRASIRASSTPTFARISEGSARVPYAGFVDYGGTVGRLRTGNIKGLEGDARNVHRMARKAHTARFFAVRPFIPTGRILYPAFLQTREAVVTQLNTSLRDALKGVGLAVDE